MYPILIICTNYTTAIYIQGQRYIQKKSILPLQWMRIGELGARIGIQDYNAQVKIIHICDNEVNAGIDLSQFPDRVDNLHKDIINIVMGGSNQSETIVNNDSNN